MEIFKKNFGRGEKGRENRTDGMNRVDPGRRCPFGSYLRLLHKRGGEKKGSPERKGGQASCSDEMQDKATSALPHSNDCNLSLLVLNPLGK